MELPTQTCSGVYAILNLVNYKVYVGSAAVSLRRRAKAHRECLRGGRHANAHLQRAWKKYGEGKFVFVVLEECRPEDCLVREQAFLDYMDVYRKGYNRCPTAGSRLGTKMSAATKAKIAAKKLGGKLSEETRAKMSEAQRLRSPPTISTRKKLKSNHWSKGPRAAEIAERIRRANMGHAVSQETRAKISATKRKKP